MPLVGGLYIDVSGVFPQFFKGALKTRSGSVVLRGVVLTLLIIWTLRPWVRARCWKIKFEDLADEWLLLVKALSEYKQLLPFLQGLGPW